MNKIKLTDAIANQALLPEGKTDFVIWDTEARGFGLRLRPTTKTWILCYRPAGAGRSSTMKRLKLGTTTTLRTATEARRVAFQILGDIARGKDPAVERAEMKRREKAKVRDLLDRYEKSLKKRNYVARKMVLSLLRTRLAAHLDRDIKDIKGTDLAAITERLEQDGLDGAADGFRSRCKAFLSWCMVTAKVIDENPSFGQRAERLTRADKLKEEAKAKALTPAQLKAVWIAADRATVFGRLVRYLILTGCRRNEGAQARREWLVKNDANQLVISFPADVVKQGRNFDVAVTPMLKSLLNSCPVDARSDLFFPSDRTGAMISGWTKFVVELRKSSGVDFTLHDLRRSMRTSMSKLKVPTDIAELCIGHSRPGIEKIYNHDEAEEAKRDAFLVWAKHVERLTSSERLAWRATRGVASPGPADAAADDQARLAENLARDEWLDANEPVA